MVEPPLLMVTDVAVTGFQPPHWPHCHSPVLVFSEPVVHPSPELGSTTSVGFVPL